jgi:hypothetical protein
MSAPAIAPTIAIHDEIMWQINALRRRFLTFYLTVAEHEGRTIVLYCHPFTTDGNNGRWEAIALGNQPTYGNRFHLWRISGTNPCRTSDGAKRQLSRQLRALGIRIKWHHDTLGHFGSTRPRPDFGDR